jgi:hypothetical protein
VGRVFDLGLKSCDLAASSVVEFDESFETLLAEFAGIAVRSSGGVVLVVLPSGCGVDSAWTLHGLTRRARRCVVIVEGDVFESKAFDYFRLACFFLPLILT